MEKLDYQEKGSKETETENYTDNVLGVIHDGTCKHYWVDQGKDPEGKGQAGCKYCPMGRYFTDEYECIEGEIRKKKE